MGRTQHTYRMRLRQVRNQMMKLLPTRERKNYDEIWKSAQHLSAPASAFPSPSTHFVITFSVLVEVIKRLNDLEKELASFSHNHSDSDETSAAVTRPSR